MATRLGFIHRYVAPQGGDRCTLLLLHGTGGDEDDMLPLGMQLGGGAALLSPRGKVLENGMPRFFRRLAEGVFDLEDLIFRTGELADFVEAAAGVHGFDLRRLFAVGYSNGANIAAGLLMLRPRLLGGAMLFRPMAPLTPETPPNLSNVPVLIAAGRDDPIAKEKDTLRLREMLERYGARVTLSWESTGHALAQTEVAVARDWLAREKSGDSRQESATGSDS